MTTLNGYEYRYYMTEEAGDITTDLAALIERIKNTHLKTIYTIDSDLSIDALYDAMDEFDTDGEFDSLVRVEQASNGSTMRQMTLSEAKLLIEEIKSATSR